MSYISFSFREGWMKGDASSLPLQGDLICIPTCSVALGWARQLKGCVTEFRSALFNDNYTRNESIDLNFYESRY